jgi:uncharacterized protein DUF6519
MKADITRDTFYINRHYGPVPKHYSRVVIQQGRVPLDADLNEQTAILLHYMRSLARDLIGPYGAPATGGGFRIDPIADVANDFSISQGRYYVDGILIENAAPALRYSQQPAVGEDDAFPNAPFIVYLDVWERLVTYVEDPRIREVALGGPDTAARAEIVWQVRVAPLDENANDDDENPCATFARPSTGSGRLRARARLDSSKSGPCIIAPSSSYRGAENQLYRVEIHAGSIGAAGAAQAPTFKWSRENGSVIFPVVGDVVISSNPDQVRLTLASLGRDERLGLARNDWVELVDDGYVMRNAAVPLLKVVDIDIDTMQVTLAGKTTVDGTGAHTLLRRWDQGKGTDADGVLAIVQHGSGDADLGDGNWTTLEDGVQILFDAAADNEYRTGDYWLIPARVVTGDVDWPHELLADGSERLVDRNPVGAALPPHGPHHYYAPLGCMEADGRRGLKVSHRCRHCFDPAATECVERAGVAKGADTAGAKKKRGKTRGG